MEKNSKKQRGMSAEQMDYWFGYYLGQAISSQNRGLEYVSKEYWHKAETVCDLMFFADLIQAIPIYGLMVCEMEGRDRMGWF